MKSSGIKLPRRKNKNTKQVLLINFNVRYHTVFGESLWISGNIPELGNNNLTEAVPMQYLNEQLWQLGIEINAVVLKPIEYKYYLKDKQGEWVSEHGFRVIEANENITIQTTDTWNYTGLLQNVYDTAPFKNVYFPTESVPECILNSTITHVFKVKAPLLKPTEVVCLLGAASALGSWDAASAVPMCKTNNDWQAAISLQTDKNPVEYKYAILNTNDNRLVQIESGTPRIAFAHQAGTVVHVLDDGFVQIDKPLWRGAGVAIPVFSLRTQNSWGVGEFADIKLLADWTASAGFKLIQLLPVNDTIATGSFKDSYPYAAISAFALHPLYIHIPAVVVTGNEKIIEKYANKIKKLNDLPAVDYEQVIQLKLEVLQKLYQLDMGATIQKKNYQQFYTANEHWLLPYAVFCYYRDKFKTVEYSKWNGAIVPDITALQQLMQKSAAVREKILFYCFVQFQLHCQLKDAVQYAHAKKVAIKGDLPIGVYRWGCDTWQNESLFYTTEQAGAPPDDFAINGQNWGFPTYNWAKMENDHYAWWQQRFTQMGHYFDAFRIDHILGFFRIWSIPETAVQGIMGRFVPCVPVHYNEFTENDIWLDEERFCKPFINDELLLALTGNFKDHVTEKYLYRNDKGGYYFKDEYNTQEKINAYFKILQPQENYIFLEQVLYGLLSNVLLFKDSSREGLYYHFRIGMEKTSSFKNLIPQLREKLTRLYINYFYQRQDAFWRAEGMKKLPRLKDVTDMLICGEDLGMVPDCVPDVMNRLGILSLEIQRMPKRSGISFFNPAQAPYLSVVTPSTHDMSTIRGWWLEDSERTRQFYYNELNETGELPLQCNAVINKKIIQQHINSPAMWSIFQMQDLLACSDELAGKDAAVERINDPANADNYWNYRMHISLEHLLANDNFTATISSMLKNGHRV